MKNLIIGVLSGWLLRQLFQWSDQQRNNNALREAIKREQLLRDNAWHAMTGM